MRRSVPDPEVQVKSSARVSGNTAAAGADPVSGAVRTVTFESMPRSRRRLAAGEEVVLDVRPHWSCLAAPVAALAAVIAGAVTALVEGVAAWVDWPILAVLVVSALWLAVRYLRWATTRMVLTTSRIIERRGVLARVSRDIPLSAVTEVGLRRSIFERVIGTGDLMVESAGRDGVELFPGLPRPASIRDEIYSGIAEWSRGPARVAGYGPAGQGYGPPEQGYGPAGQGYGPAGSIPAQIDQLDRLRRQGAITEEEFAMKKAELLNRL